jgi:uncharacterized membrane protein
MGGAMGTWKLSDIWLWIILLVFLLIVLLFALNSMTNGQFS